MITMGGHALVSSNWKNPFVGHNARLADAVPGDAHENQHQPDGAPFQS